MNAEQFDDLMLLLVGNARRPAMTCNVRPRYTGGSGASVDVRTLLKVAEEERDAYEHASSGIYGKEQQEKAKRDGLGPVPKGEFVRRGIAEVTIEHAGHWLVFDLLTKEIYDRPFINSMRAIAKSSACEKCRGARERLMLHSDGGTP